MMMIFKYKKKWNASFLFLRIKSGQIENLYEIMINNEIKLTYTYKTK